MSLKTKTRKIQNRNDRSACINIFSKLLLTNNFRHYLWMNSTMTFFYYLHFYLCSMHWLLRILIFTIHCSTRFSFLQITFLLLRATFSCPIVLQNFQRIIGVVSENKVLGPIQANKSLLSMFTIYLLKFPYHHLKFQKIPPNVDFENKLYEKFLAQFRIKISHFLQYSLFSLYLYYLLIRDKSI